mmetsp:Transcript_34498/g.79752  ORF Transcript_34498/g.79752 Transcript_34498/m.79752 type:complete len:274 (-) Transcript_34498:571-1392(-)
MTVPGNFWLRSPRYSMRRPRRKSAVVLGQRHLDIMLMMRSGRKSKRRHSFRWPYNCFSNRNLASSRSIPFKDFVLKLPLIKSCANTWTDGHSFKVSSNAINSITMPSGSSPCDPSAPSFPSWDSSAQGRASFTGIYVTKGFCRMKAAPSDGVGVVSASHSRSAPADIPHISAREALSTPISERRETSTIYCSRMADGGAASGSASRSMSMSDSRSDLEKVSRSCLGRTRDCMQSARGQLREVARRRILQRTIIFSKAGTGTDSMEKGSKLVLV